MRLQHQPACQTLCTDSASVEILRVKRKGFTLLEVLVVVAIIVMLAGIGGYYLVQRYEEAKLSLALSNAKTLASTVEQYYTANDQYPPELEALTQPGPNGGSPYCGPEKLLDPWNKPYQLDVSGARPEVFTMAPNGKRISSLNIK